MLPPPPAWARDDLPSPIAPEQQQRRRPAEPKVRKPNPPPQDTTDQPKKPRHRHSAFQLAALNELYDKDEHPALEERTSLAERLGMETKTVNSWFQNKRASCKKRHKGSSATTPAPNARAGSSVNTSAPTKKPSSNNNSVELPPISALIASVSARPGLGLGPPPSRQPEYDDYDDEEYVHRLPPTKQQLFYAGNPSHRHLDAAEQSQRPKARSRPSAAQTEELRKVYDVDPHPSKDVREQLGHKIGMRYQSVTNWFQNQRSIAKKRKDEEEAHAAALAAHAASSSKPRMFSPFPPATSAAHPSLSLAVPPATSHPSLAIPHHSQHSISAPPPRARRSLSAAPLNRGHDLSHGSSRSVSRPSSPRVSPYRMPSDRVQGPSRLQERPRRPRRTRPEPHQLEALKKLFRRTSTPSIEERGALALEVGMDVGKVTNWFRNLRQTARKRATGLQDQLEEGEIDQDDQDELMDVDADDVSLATYQSRSATPMHSTGVSSSVSSPLVHALHPSQPPPPYSLEDAREEMPVPRYEARYTPPSPMQPPSEENLRQLYTYARAMRQRPPPLNEHSSSSDPDVYPDGDSHMGSEEDVQEAVTPSPESSPPPPSALASPAVFSMGVQKAVDVKRAQVKVETGVKVEDALLLLSFHHHVVH